MSRAEFEEKQYETAFLQELAGGLGPLGLVFSSGQLLEKIVGYDAAAAPDVSNVIWRLLSVPRPPGIRLLPAHWQPGTLPPLSRLPTVPVSLVLQFKRPEYLIAPNARQWSLWRCPYFRFAVTSHQQVLLARLERKLKRDALVRYASPAFVTFAELEAAQFGRSTIAQTGFVSPSAVGRHKVWTYLRPGTAGRPNPRGRLTTFDSIGSLLASIMDVPLAPSQLIRQDQLAEHVRTLASRLAPEATSARRAILAWRARLGQSDLGLLPTTLDTVVAIALIESMLSEAGLTWLVVGRGSRSEPQDEAAATDRTD